jgi:asparagine synthase (glutamine-hydrolysing)
VSDGTCNLKLVLPDTVNTSWVARLGRSTLELLEPSDAQIAEAGASRAVFGGVLDNRADLAAAAGFEPRVDGTEAELLLHAYLDSGESILPTLRGAFGLVLLDSRADVGLCVRDPLGVYPLFTADVGEELLVSPSIESLLAQPGVSAQVNVPALADHLLHRWPDPTETYFSSIRRVPPGHALRLAPHERRLYRYWQPVPDDAPVDWIEEDELDSFDRLLERAVTRCLERGSAGVFLSGGLDSVSVAAVAADAARRRGLPEPQALSLVFPDPDVNEEDVQTGVAKGLGLPQVLLSWDEAVGPRGLVREALDLSAQSPSPLMNLWAPAYHRLAREGTSRGCTAILTGAGGDEWLGVTPLYAADLIRTFDAVGLYRLLAAQRRSYHLSDVHFLWNILWRFGARPLVAEAVSRTAPSLLRARKLNWVQTSIPDWIAPGAELRSRIVERALGSDSLPSNAARRPPSRGHSRFYFEELRLSLDHTFVAMEMEETFERGRLVGAALLAPYWDADLLELLYRTPPELLNRGGRAKGLVRDALARRFPNLGFERQRKVSALRFATSLLFSETATAWPSIGARKLAEAGVVDPKSIERTVESLLTAGDARSIQTVWDVLNLEVWLRSHI